MGGIFKLWFELPKSVFPTVRKVICMYVSRNGD